MHLDLHIRMRLPVRMQENCKKYKLRLSAAAEKCLADETPKELHNVHTQIIGSVRQLCKAAQKACKELGYEPRILAEDVTAEAREVGWNLAQLCLREHDDAGEKKMALIAGGETVVHLRGKGKGGRNQELAFSAMKVIAGQQNMAIFFCRLRRNGWSDRCSRRLCGWRFL